MHRNVSRLSPLLGGILLATSCAQEPLGPTPEFSRRESTHTAFTASDLPVAILDPGVLELLPNRILARGLVVRARIEASDSRFTGFMVVTANANWTLAGEGPAWGTFTLEVDGGGEWVGRWHGWRTITGTGEWTTAIRWVVSGHGAEVAGLRAGGTESLATTEVIPAFYVGQLDGWIRGR